MYVHTHEAKKSTSNDVISIKLWQKNKIRKKNKIFFASRR